MSTDEAPDTLDVLLDVPTDSLRKVASWMANEARVLRRNTGNILNASAVSVMLQTIVDSREQTLRLSAEWEVLDSVRVIDPDGWRDEFEADGKHYSPQPWGTPINHIEWRARLVRSTMEPRRFDEHSG